MIKLRWFSSFVAEEHAALSHRHSSPTHSSVICDSSPVSAISSAPGSCRCCRFFHRLSARHEREREKKKNPNSDSNLSDDSLHMCHLVVSSGKRSTSSTRACLHCAAGRCRFLCDLRGRLTGALQRRLRKRKRQNENVVSSVRFRKLGDANSEIKARAAAPPPHA